MDQLYKRTQNYTREHKIIQENTKLYKRTENYTREHKII